MSSDLDTLEREVLRVVDENPGITFKELREDIGCAKSTLSVKKDHLSEEGYIVDKDWKDNKSEYYVAEDVEVSAGFDLEKVLTFRTFLNVVEALGFLSLVLYFAESISYLVIVAFLVGFAPTMLYNILSIVSDEQTYSVEVNVSD